jgi:pimeloyl-ACP methyl ester carboxylesterase
VKSIAHNGRAQNPHSFGTGMADELRFVANSVGSGIIPHSGHWIMEENPQATVKIVAEFLAK